MKLPTTILHQAQIDSTWTLFLDRDGVINRKLDNDYVKSWDEFEFLPGVLEALKSCNAHFGRIIIVTNQQGVGKGLMLEGDLLEIHQKMQDSIEAVGGRLDAMYFCPNLKEENPLCRKPDIGMALQAQNDFPEINFSKSIVVGDSFSDMGFAEKLGAVPVFIYNETPILENDVKLTWSYHTNLLHFASYIQPLVKR